MHIVQISAGQAFAKRAEAINAHAGVLDLSVIILPRREPHRLRRSDTIERRGGCTPQTGQTIFISYRRADAQGHAQYLHHRLAGWFDDKTELSMPRTSTVAKTFRSGWWMALTPLPSCWC
jgi:hypothetical protein